MKRVIKKNTKVCLEMLKEAKTEQQPEPQPEPAKLPPPSERPDLYEPFILEHALKGRPVVDINGEKAIAIYHIKEAKGTESELSVVFEDKKVFTYTIDGRVYTGEYIYLFHPKEETKSTWVNIYRKENGVLDCGAEHSKFEIAKKVIGTTIGQYITTVEIKSTSKWQ